MAQEEKLPWEMIEEILSRVPPQSLARFKTVSKKWNALFEDKMFLDNHKLTFRFILTNKYKFYSVSIDPEVVVRELTLDIPGLESKIIEDLVNCDKFLLCCMDKQAAVCNPWLNQTRVVKNHLPGLKFRGVGYDCNKRVLEKYGYKTLARYKKDNHTWWKIHDFATDAWKDHNSKSSRHKTRKRAKFRSCEGVSLNGNMYWLAHYDRTSLLYHLRKFDFRGNGFSKICDLPCGKNHPQDALVLGVFKGDRFSLLKQCYITKKIEIWVTNIINNDDVVVFGRLLWRCQFLTCWILYDRIQR